jgi:putative oxidoreductase
MAREPRREGEPMDRARATTGAAVWTLSVLLALIFIAAGVFKLVGAETFWLQAAAMRGFPPWMRVLVGLFEVAGAVALLVPALAIYGAIGLGILMIPAAITQAMSGEPGLYVPFVLFALLMIVGWWRDPTTMRGLYHGLTASRGPVVREGVIAGIIGATCVAVWFFIIDLVGGRPLFTPTTLGDALFSLFRPELATVSPTVSVIGYTIVHYAAFIVAGVLAANVVAWAGREPALLLGFGILFVAFEVGFYGFVALLQQASVLGDLAWSQVMIGNLISAAAMGAYIWRVHPQLREQFAHARD